MRHSGLALLLLLTPALGAAGGPFPPPPSSSSGTPTVAASPFDLFLGYTYTEAGQAGLHGLQLTGTFPLGRSLRIVVDVAGHRGSFAQADLSQITLLAGARWTPAAGRFAPFVEALLGGVRTKTSVSLSDGSLSDSDSDWGTAFGGGVDYPVSSRWAARAEFDLFVLRAEGAWEMDPRLSVGVVYRFGS